MNQLFFFYNPLNLGHSINHLAKKMKLKKIEPIKIQILQNYPDFYFQLVYLMTLDKWKITTWNKLTSINELIINETNLNCVIAFYHENFLMSITIYKNDIIKTPFKNINYFNEIYTKERLIHILILSNI